jgi:SulP family sulfate permease
MSGIGCIIIALQLARLFGHEPAGSGTIPALLEVPKAVSDPHFGALFVGLLTLTMVFTWPAKWGKVVPAPLAALITGTVIGLYIEGLPILGDIPTGLPGLVVPTIESDTAIIIFEAAFILAVLGAIDSLLTSLVADNMTRTRHNSNRELIGQGLGNTVAGFFGGIPGAGATMRTVVNIRTGGSTKISGMLHSLLLLAVVAVLAPLAEKIPHAVLAGILVKVGYDIIDIAYLKRAHKGPRFDLMLMALVLGLTVFVDLITAVLAGVVIAALAFVKQIAEQLRKASGADGEEDHSLSDEEAAIYNEISGDITLFDFGGPLSFGAAADLGHQVRERVGRNDHKALLLDFSQVSFMDVSAARAVETITVDAHSSGKRVYACGIRDEVNAVLSGLGVNEYLSADMQYPSREAALRAASVWVKED